MNSQYIKPFSISLRGLLYRASPVLGLHMFLSGKNDSIGAEYRTYTLDQQELDKANKDKKNKFFPSGFKVSEMPP